MGSTTCVVCTPWPQRHGVRCSLPPPCTGMKVPKNLCNESIEEAMGSMSWLDGALDVQLTWTHDVYAWHRGMMPCAPENEQPYAQFHGSMLWSLDQTEGDKHMPGP
uniref:Uncharacterized protein n=1 Tax=Vitis vinifera TaxID=29760 RepID=A5BEG6_VITVI|nr:hypothetical protein VITISV_028649 [Vitis vinifera]